MIIKTEQIRDFLVTNGIEHEWSGEPNDEYKITSAFDPEPNGFFYWDGDELPQGIEYSLILSNNLFDSTDNCILKIEHDSKILFYEILDHFFKRVSTGMVAKTAVIDPEAQIGNNVQIDDFTTIGKSKIGDNCIIGSHSSICDGTEIKANTIVESHASIGTQGVKWVWNKDESSKILQPQFGGVLIKENCFLGANAIVVRGSLNEDTTIGKYTLIAPGTRIGHGTKIGSHVHLANNVITAGNSKVGDCCFVGSSAVFQPSVNIHPYTMVGTGAVVVKNTSKEGLTLVGIPAREVETKANPSGMPKPKQQ